MVHSFVIIYILDVVLDSCIIYRLLLVLTQRDGQYQKEPYIVTEYLVETCFCI
jgi:hypothetical protein